MPSDEKVHGIKYLQAYQESISDAKSVLIIGGGAVGVQMACDLKELYPDKVVTLAHSRDKLIPVYHKAMNHLIKNRFQDLGVKYAYPFLGNTTPLY
jgi:apoptosis-inducing factor 2